MNSYTIPSIDQILDICGGTPNYMVKNTTPYAVVFERWMSESVCDSIIEEGMKEELYLFHGCEAKTRELNRPLSVLFSPIIDTVWPTNRDYFGFELYSDPGAWLQTYDVGDSYQLHVDSAIGQSRKLTAVVMLTDESEYEGGQLELIIPPNRYRVPKTKGTVVVFPSWTYHQVTPVERGIRQTLNLGYWGPPFK